MKRSIGTFVLALAGGAAGFGIMRYMEPAPRPEYSTFGQPAFQVAQPNLAASSPTTYIDRPDFVQTSASATPAVVHIRSFFKQTTATDPFHGMFGNAPGARPQASGSGVIISTDGYIATNNHVVKGAEKVEVTLEDKRSYEAEVIGVDPNTDLALLKIKETELPSLPFGNSNEVQVGEWVLAVGNPFNLTSTVTAGIVSAKGRSLNLLDEELAIESFIQTDAAVNPGNSGGALINSSGQLVGINTAIASETGSYAGYSFAIPVNIVRKVMADLREYGQVQRGIIGVQIRNINAEMAEKYSLPTLAGAYVTGTIAGGAAEAAGIKPGDIITKVNATPVRGSSELQEEIGTYRPGDKVQLTVIRDGETTLMEVILRNREGTTTLSELSSDKAMSEDAPKATETAALGRLGAEMATLTFKDKTDMGLDNGVKVMKLGDGKLRDAGIEEGFVIIRVNKKFVDEPKEVERLIEESEGGILIEGVTAKGKKQFYAFE
jgi:serine protease Do